ncbi:MAG: hypothetical protein ABIL06_20300 [Pseudomonadota bacterium]
MPLLKTKKAIKGMSSGQIITLCQHPIM